MGLILPRNRIAFPGGNPGFDQSHPAAAGTRVSAVASPTGNLTVLNRAVVTSAPTITGTVTNKVSSIGPVINATAASGNYISCNTVNPGATPVSVTVGLIVRPTASTSSRWFRFNSTSALDANEVLTLSLVPNLNTGGTNFSSGITLTVGTPYFVAVSMFSNNTINWVIRDLSTGDIFTSTASIPAGTVTTSGTGTFFGGTGNVGSFADCAAFTYALNNYLSLPQLRQWAQAPWDFWYPPTAQQLIFSSGRPGPAAISAAAASTWQPSDAIAATQTFAATAASVWQPSDAIAAALSISASVASVWQPSDAIVASQGVSATVASVWKPSDAIAAAQTLPITASVASVWQPTDSAVAVSAPPAPQPGPQIAFPLRERTYRRRFLGFGYDPKFVISKDRPGPIRIIEFIGEIKDE